MTATDRTEQDLVGWLREQLDADEAVIRRNLGRNGLGDDGCFPDYRTYDGEDLNAADEFLDRFRPPRVLAEVEAKRRILDLHAPVILRGGADAKYYATRVVCRSCEPPRGALDDEPIWPCPTIRLLAEPYADRPGYRESWRP